ncbi:MAG TPA: type III pantothenate kinase, partial [Spirochaetia bacterium]|nr:type III pantothenate kinase [Spirochaetia bacterium]
LLGPGMVTGLRITTENPAEVGADLVANAVAAHERVHGSCVVVDFGTALSFTAVSSAGELRGVAIAPGLSASVDALARTTAQLPRIPLSPPPRAIGRNTVHSIQSGVVLGCVALVEGLIGRIRAELEPDARVIATGGQSPLIAPLLTEPAIVEPWLTLEGLRIVSQRTVA